jgi:septum formation topological specificity factor MinE
MSFLGRMKSALGIVKPSAGKVAKDRLSIMIMNQRESNLFTDVEKEALLREVGEVVKKHVRMATNRNPSFTCNISFPCSLLLFLHCCQMKKMN